MKPVLDRLAAEEATANIAEYALLLAVVTAIVAAAAASIAADLGTVAQASQRVFDLALGAIR